MNDSQDDGDSSAADATGRDAEHEWNPLKRNPVLQIWLIAGVFYVILVGMFLFVLVLIIRG